MINITKKTKTQRTATAQAQVWLPKTIRDQLVNGDIRSKKGAVFQTAITAGVMGLKQTPQLIPFCHQINIEGSQITIEMQGESAIIQCWVSTYGKTGVEMEALVGAQIAALTIYDMCKSMGYGMKIERCHLLQKTGGKNDYQSN